MLILAVGDVDARADHPNVPAATCDVQQPRSILKVLRLVSGLVNLDCSQVLMRLK